jgi:type IV secretory pathway TraG/TraD family ATPase VirD4
VAAPFDPSTVLRQWPRGKAFTIADATTGVFAAGATGSGKTSGVSKHLAIGYMEQGQMGGLVLAAKVEECAQWISWAKEAGREKDLVIFDASGKHRFNFLQWEAERGGEGGGLVINIVALLDEIATAIAKASGNSGGGGDNKFFEDALHLMLVELVALAATTGPVTLPRLRSLAASAARSMAELQTEAWRENSEMARALHGLAARAGEMDAEDRADAAEFFAYWTADYPGLSSRTRGVIDMMAAMMVQPFLFRPCRRLFTTDTTIKPEDTFAGKIIIVDLPIQEFRLAGRVAALAWKHCFQIAVMRRAQARGNRPVFLWADECQNFATSFDAEYQAVARSAGGCTVYLTQNRESLRRVLGSNDTVDALLGNLQTKFFAQNSSTDTGEWASKLLGSRFVEITGRNMGLSMGGDAGGGGGMHGGTSVSQQLRAYVEPAEFAQLKRGGPAYDYRVTTIVYKGGELFEGGGGEPVPYTRLTFNQLR